jgi:2-(1,2-epoxy-1,2-dihydrophenyl)acetyl-CoA isomerase
MGCAMSDEALLEVDGGLATVTLNRRAAFNAFNVGMGHKLLELFVECDQRDDVRAVLFTGTGPAFCSGGDIRQMAEHVAKDGDGGRLIKTMTVHLHGVIATMQRMQKPVIAAVNGPAAGAGLSLALACDVVLASDASRFAIAYSAIGLTPDGGSTYFLPRLIGAKRTFELYASNRQLKPDEALQMGLISRIIPAADLMSEARAYANRLASGPTAAYGKAKELLLSSESASLETQMELERNAIAASSKTADFKEGIDAFLNKRPAKFSGK